MRKPIPPELSRIGADLARFHWVGRDELHGPCVYCGGHDRMAIFTKRSFPHWNWFCRKCHPENGWLDEINPNLKEPLSQDKLNEMKLKRDAEESRRRLELDRVLQDYTSREVWDAYQRKLTDEHRLWWEKQGVPNGWQDYLRLGYTPEKVYRNKAGELISSPAYTIPYFHQGFSFKTMQYRLFDAPDPNDRYRFENGLDATFYMTMPDRPLADQAVICEGAKKAMVVSIRAGNDNMTVLGIPSKSTTGGIEEYVKDCGRVYIVLDPDAIDKARDLARRVGNSARVIDLPVKADDAFLLYGLKQKGWEQFIRQGVKVS
jgi:hypothetical protein